jgi:hypothetical protein
MLQIQRRYRFPRCHLQILIFIEYKKQYCTMLHLFDNLWLDKIIPKNNDEGRAIYGNLEN